MERKLLSVLLAYAFFLGLVSSCADFGRQRGGMSDKEAAGITEAYKKGMSK